MQACRKRYVKVAGKIGAVQVMALLFAAMP